MKHLFLILSFLTSSFSISYDIDCIGAKKENNFYDLPYTFGGEFYSADTVGGHLDTCNFGMTYWDNNSPVCGGNSSQNILKELYNLDCDDSSFIFSINDTSGVNTYSLDNDSNMYQNNLIFVDGLPCLDSNTNSLTLGYYNAETNENIGFVTATGLSIYGDELIYDVTIEDKKIQKNKCSNNPYDELEPQALEQNSLFNTHKISIDNILNTNDNSNSIYTNILSAFNNLTLNNNDNTNNTDISIDTDTSLNNISNTDLVTNETSLNSSMNTFTTDYINILDTTFGNYLDVFGFGGYGSAPSTISFNLLGRTYDVFNTDNFDPFVDTFRNAFISFAYLWGFLIIIKDFK